MVFAQFFSDIFFVHHLSIEKAVPAMHSFSKMSLNWEPFLLKKTSCARTQRNMRTIMSPHDCATCSISLSSHQRSPESEQSCRQVRDPSGGERGDVVPVRGETSHGRKFGGQPLVCNSELSQTAVGQRADAGRWDWAVTAAVRGILCYWACVGCVWSLWLAEWIWLGQLIRFL